MAGDPGTVHLTVNRRDATADVTVRGEVDIHTCREVERVLTELAGEGLRTVTLDVGEVTFIDSSGLRALVVGHKALEEHGGSLVVANPTTTAARLLEVTGLDSVFEVEANEG
jgi:anti-sigma B factor antagonist